MDSIIYRDPELEASFSFSCYDFNSAIHVSSDEEAGINDDEYIEIAIEQPRNISYDDDDDGGSHDPELELRRSFSSPNFPFFEISNSNDNNLGLSRLSTVESVGKFSETIAISGSSSLSTMNSTLSCSSGKTFNNWVAGTGASRLTHDKRTNKRRVRKDDIISDENNKQSVTQNNINKLELLRSRKAEKMATKTTNGGMMMKFLIKCRSISIRALLASFMKPYQIIKISPQTEKKKRSKWLVPNERLNGERSKVFDINLDAIKGVLESMGTSFGRKDRRTNSRVSCCNNKNSSTILQQGNIYTVAENNKVYARDNYNSIQAAIAHCKRSFGHTSEFSF